MCKEEADKVAVRCGCGRECRSSIRTCVWGSARNAGSCTASSAPTSVSSRPVFGNGVLGPVAALALIFFVVLCPRTNRKNGRSVWRNPIPPNRVRLVYPPETPFFSPLAVSNLSAYLLVCLSALLDVLVFYGLAFTHQIGADRDLSGFECGFSMFEECFSDSV